MTIYYIGEGSNRSGYHTEEEFLDIMKNKVDKVDKRVSLKKNKFRDYEIEDWIEYTNAIETKKIKHNESI